MKYGYAGYVGEVKVISNEGDYGSLPRESSRRALSNSEPKCSDVDDDSRDKDYVPDQSSNASSSVSQSNEAEEQEVT